ncbi:MAG: hypothetical protein K2M87_04865 [Muribaculaceae bacterium]|nr:hypothetical protein [Muribaculaceae bacterium]
MTTHHQFLAAAALASAALLPGIASAATDNRNAIVETSAYSWVGDTIYQGPFKAWAEGSDKIVSNYHGRPGYFMPVEQIWTRKNDLSAYPVLKGGQTLHQAIYNMGLDEMVNAVEPDTTLRTGKEWAGVWTRDVSYSIILSMAALQPEASMISLMKKVNPSGQIIQDTGSGGAWPISTDRMIWVLAAWELYKVTGDNNWLRTVYPIACRSIAKDDATIRSEQGLVKGETSFIDWREQSYPKWMQTTDISQSEAMGTNVLYAAALQAVSDMATALGKKKEAADYAEASQSLARKIDETFYMPDKGYYGMYTYGRDNKILNPRAETLGEALAILYDIAPAERQKEISQHNPTTPFGPAIFYPQIADMPNYHNNALWPFVAGYWTLAQAKAGNEQGTLEGIGSIFRPAALFATNKENFNLDNGDFYTELNSSNMLWSLSANLAVTQQLLFGIHFEAEGLRISPFVPQTMAADRTLENFPYRNAKLNISVSGFGDKVKSLTLNGKALDPNKTIPAKMLAKGGDIKVIMDNQPIAPMQVNHQPNLKAPLTPQTWIERTPQGDMLTWNPIEYIAGYKVLRNGKEVTQTLQTSYLLTQPGEWQVIGVSGDGTESFASEPRSNRTAYTIEFPNETATAKSAEISYPSALIEGMNAGFVETDTRSNPVKLDVTIPEDGVYSLQVRYANGNGPVNTENKAAVRTLLIDGVKAGTLVMPTRGVANWNDWGLSNGIKADLKKGNHTFEIVYLPEDENMNIATNHALLDRIVLTLQ